MPHNSASQEPGGHHISASSHIQQSSVTQRPKKTVGSLFRALFRRDTEPKSARYPSRASLSGNAVYDQDGGLDEGSDHLCPSVTEPGTYYHASYKASSGSTSEDRVRFQSHSQAPLFPSAPAIPQAMMVSTFEGAHDVNINGSPQFFNVGKQEYVIGGIHGLDILKEFVSFSALHDSSAQDPERLCHPGTRESVLKQMRNWINDIHTPERILWLHGPAGVGKSAIAQTISQSPGRDIIAATFFFFRSDPIRNDINRLFPTLAWQLAKSIPGMRDYIARVLNEDCDVPKKAIEIQFEQLIAQPLQAVFLQSQGPAYIVVIDGIDECSGEKLQQRFLKRIGMAVSTAHFPLRFILSSRPEAHIQDAFNQFQSPTLQIDLADIDGWHQDIEKYLTEEFSSIASKQQLDLAWPGQDIIQGFVDKSSGQFIYASTIIRFVGDEYSSATSQLNIILGLKPSDGEAPFAYLDPLYMEILQRQRYQWFLKDFLSILITRSGISEDNLVQDDHLLLNVDQNELRRKLRGMHSVLKFEPYIDFHHRSFLDFLKDPSRSLQYHTNGQKGAVRRYLELVVDTLVRYSSRVLREPEYHGTDHFAPKFAQVFMTCRRKIELPLQDWEEVLEPLRSVKDDWLKLPAHSSPWKRGPCDSCTSLFVVDNLLLHLSVLRGSLKPTIPHISYELQGPLLPDDMPRKVPGHEFSTSNEAVGKYGATQDGQRNDLDICLSLLLSKLRGAMTPISVSIIGLMQDLLYFDPITVASKICSISDAEHLVDLIYHLINTRCILKYCGQEATRNSTLLALGIYARLPLLPRSLFIDKATLVIDRDDISLKYRGKRVMVWNESWDRINVTCQFAFVGAVLYHENICPLLGIYYGGDSGLCIVYNGAEGGHILDWKSKVNPSAAEIQERMIQVAKAIQYIHAVGTSNQMIRGRLKVFVDLNLHAKVLGHGLCPQFCIDTPFTSTHGPWWIPESDVEGFGKLMREMYGDFFSDPSEDGATCPHKPHIPDNVIQLIQRCCADDPSSRPTMDMVVVEMESWVMSNAGMTSATASTC